MPSYLKLQHRIWYLRWRVPRDVRDHPFFGGKSEIVVTLRTGDKAAARLRAAPLVDKFKAQVAEARGKSGAVGEWLEWRARIATADRETEEYSDTMDALEERVAERFNVKYGYSLSDLMARSGPQGQRALKIALGKETPLEPHIDDWAKLYGAKVELKTAHMSKNAVKRFVEKYPSAHLITHQSVGEWIVRRTSEEGASPRTVRRELGHLRSFWDYLRDSLHIVQEAPFDRHKIGKAKHTHNTKRLHFGPDEVVRLYGEALKRDDEQLAHLIKLAAYSGARINELCMLRSDKCVNGVLQIEDTKTEAGIRTVPVHSKLQPLVNKLIRANSNSFLLSNLSSANKFNDRAHGIGHRFSRLKQKLGFGPRHVFHSFRNTVITQLVQAGVSDNVIDDIVGHEYLGMRRRYLAGCSMEQKAKAIENLKYPGL